jgi:hypothetical protein
MMGLRKDIRVDLGRGKTAPGQTLLRPEMQSE